LNDLTTITPEVARGLSEFRGTLKLNGITSMDLSLARELASQDSLYLENIFSVTPDVAKELAKVRHCFAGELALHQINQWKAK